MMPPTTLNPSAHGEEQREGRRTVAKADLPRRAHRAAVVSAEIGVEPTDNDWHRGVRAHCGQKEGCVLQLRVVVYDEEDQEASEGDRGREEHEHEAMSYVIRRKRGEHRERESTGPWWDREQLGTDSAVS